MNPRVVRIASLVALAVVSVQLVRLGVRPVSDPDLWWHLRLGEELRSVGPFGWSDVSHWSPFATADWVPSAPLSDLVLSWAEGRWGLPGVAWLFGATLLALLVALHLCNLRMASGLAAPLATALAIAGASASLTPRPQVASFLLLAVVMNAWFATERDLRPRWWLVPLSWLWAMVHGYWLVGVLVGACVTAGLLLGRRVRGRAAIRLAAVPVLCLVAAAATPIGPRLVLAPLSVGSRNRFVEEGARTAFDRSQPWLVLGMVVVTLAVWLVRRTAFTWGRLALLVQALGWLVVAERTVALAALLMAPLLAAALGSLLDDVPSRARAPRREVGVLGALAVPALVAVTLAVPRTADRPADVPTAFDAVLADQEPGATVLNDYDAGGWLAWRHPHLRVTVDPLADAYPVAHLERYGRALLAQPGWPGYVRDTGARIAVLSEDVPLVAALVRAGWSVQGRDEGYALLVAPAAQAGTSSSGAGASDPG